MRALILGGGIAGLSSAICLSRAGWTVSVYERAEAIRPLGAGLSLWSNATTALDQLGLLERVTAAAAPIRSMMLADQRGTAILHRQVEGEALMITRAALQGCLVQALDSVPLHLGHTVARCETSSNEAVVHFEDETHSEADLVIDAGGIRSAAGEAWSSASPAYAGYGGVVALTDPVDGVGLEGEAAEYWGKHERFGVFELPEGRRYWFYMRTQEENEPVPDHAFVNVRAQHFPTVVSTAVRHTPDNSLTPFAIYAKPAPKRLGRGRIIAVGDAAHAMEPNLGQGACQALEDAVALGAAAGRVAPDQILGEFERLRLARIRFIVQRAAEGRYGAHGRHFSRAAMRQVLRSVPNAVTSRMMRVTQTMPAYR